MKPILQQVVLEREKKGHTFGIIQQSGEVCRSPNAVSYLFARTNMYNVKGTYVQACDKFSDRRTEQLKRKLSYLGQIVTMRIANSLWTTVHFST